MLMSDRNHQRTSTQNEARINKVGFIEFVNLTPYFSENFLRAKKKALFFRVLTVDIIKISHF